MPCNKLFFPTCYYKTVVREKKLFEFVEFRNKMIYFGSLRGDKFLAVHTIDDLFTGNFVGHNEIIPSQSFPFIYKPAFYYTDIFKKKFCARFLNLIH